MTADRGRGALAERPSALPGHPEPDRGSGPWVVRLICCGYEGGTERYETWGEADAFRESYVRNSAGHDRTGIITRDERGVYLPDGLDGLAAAVEALPWFDVQTDADGTGGRMVDRAEVLRLIREAGQ